MRGFPKSSFQVQSSQGTRSSPGEGSSFCHFSNKNSSHFMVTLANIFRLNTEDGSSLARFQRMLESYSGMLVTLGLSAQSMTQDWRVALYRRRLSISGSILAVGVRLSALGGGVHEKGLLSFCWGREYLRNRLPFLIFATSGSEAIVRELESRKGRSQGLHGYGVL